MSGPEAPRVRLDESALFARALTWTVDPSHRFWFSSQVDGSQIFMRINPTFPDSALYSLLVDEDEFVDFDDLPDAWSRVGPLTWPDDASDTS